MRTLASIISLLTVLTLSGCVNNPGGPDDEDDVVPEDVVFHVSLTEPDDEATAPLADGETLETEIENREAILAVLKGIPSSEPDEAGKFELIRAVDRELYRDVDDGEGPEQWLTVAEVQDDDGNVLWTDRVNTLFQLLEYLEVVLNQQSALNFGVEQIFGFVSMQFPQLLEFAVKVPLGIEGGTQYVLKVPKEDGTLYEVWRTSIDDLTASAEEPRVDGEVKTIVETGEPADRIDVVIVGDGYTADQQEEFELDAQAIAEELVETEPVATTAESYNVHSVWTPSNEGGAGYDCTGIQSLDRGCKRALRDTQYETVFVLTALADRFNLDLQDTSDRVAMPLQVGRLYEAAASVPFDEIIMISNTKRRSGFAGLYVSVVTAFDPRLQFPEVAVHELGHSFGILGDEYMVEGDPCLFNEPRIPLPPNIAAEVSRDELKWAHHVDESTELPTPPAETEIGTVGAYQGAYNCPELYRPEHVCMMRNSGEEFCAVCSEQMVSRVYSVVDPVAHAPATVTSGEAGLTFEVPLRDDAVESVEWILGSESIGTGATLELEATDVPETWTALEALVSEDTGYVAAEHDRLRQTITWWIRR